MKGIAAGVSSFNNSMNGSPSTGPTDPLQQNTDLEELLKKLAKYFPQQQIPQTGPVKVGL